MTTTPARRFYKAVSVVENDDGFCVALDQRTLRTPKGARFTAPTRALAEAIAQEWKAQGEHIHPASMPLTQLAFAAVDSTAEHRRTEVDYIAAHAETDLVAHRADHPAELVARQAAVWDPLVAWARESHGLDLAVVTGVIAAPGNARMLSAFRGRMEALDDFRLTALAQATGISGSAVIALALLEGRIDAEAAFAAAALDNLWSLEHWGEDAEARARLESQRKALGGVARFLAALA